MQVYKDCLEDMIRECVYAQNPEFHCIVGILTNKTSPNGLDTITYDKISLPEITDFLKDGFIFKSIQFNKNIPIFSLAIETKSDFKEYVEKVKEVILHYYRNHQRDMISHLLKEYPYVSLEIDAEEVYLTHRYLNTTLKVGDL